ncbi:MAG: DUF1778 domain-containing protein [Agitococcus sp.]
MQQTRTEHPLSLRLPDVDLSLIDRAANIQGCSRTQFMRNAAIHAATQTILEQSLVIMSHEGFAAFQASIDAEPQIAPAIAALRQHKAPWDKP